MGQNLILNAPINFQHNGGLQVLKVPGGVQFTIIEGGKPRASVVIDLDQMYGLVESQVRACDYFGRKPGGL